MIEIWKELPEEFRLSDPEAQITVWRGDKLGKHITGMMCRLADRDPSRTVLEIARQGRDALLELVDKHTSAHPKSPLVSVATDIRLAQYFAGFRSEKETIYEIRVAAHRLLRDPESIGARRWPIDSELFVVGQIVPSDIVRVKTNNHHQAASELVYWKDGRMYIMDDSAGGPGKISTPTLPNPLGTWVTPVEAMT